MKRDKTRAGACSKKKRENFPCLKKRDFFVLCFELEWMLSISYTEAYKPKREGERECNLSSCDEYLSVYVLYDFKLKVCKCGM